MSAKKVNIKRKPTSKDAEAWVTSTDTEGEGKKEGQGGATQGKKSTRKKKVAMKRLTIDIPETLHKRLKIRAAREGRTMAEILRQILEEKG